MLILLQFETDAPHITNCFCFVTETIQTRTSSVFYLCVPTPSKILASQLLSPSNKLQS